MLIWIIIATVGVSLISIIGLFTLSLKEEFFNKTLLFLIALSVGALLGGAFLHLLPEAAEAGENIFIFVLFGIILFLLIEKLLHWRHCHDGKCEKHPVTYLTLIGDTIHNFIDGLIIAGAFLVNWKIGLITLAAIALHEIPQELGDFAILIYGGFTKKRALILNFLTALSSILGGIIGYFVLDKITFALPYILALAAGGFIYIALADLIPELHKEGSRNKQILLFLVVIFGMILMYLLRFFE